MAKLYNLAGMSTATTGTGTITLGSAIYAHLTFALAGVSNGETITYAIKDGANSEIGRGVYTSSGTTLTRTVLKSTNSDAAISLSGSAEVYITPAAEDIIEPPTASVDSEIVLFSSTTGDVIKRATTTGILKATSGVIAAATAGTDYVAPTAVAGTNLLINGDFQINQRGFAGGSLAVGVYGFDRWKAGTGGCSISISGYVVTLASGPIAQVIEPSVFGLSSFASTNFTVSVDTPSVNMTVSFGSDSDTITAGSGRRSVSLTTTGGDTGNLTLTLSAGSSVTFGRVKIEVGNVATDWRSRTFQEELIMCSRYYEKSYESSVVPGTNLGSSFAGMVSPLFSVAFVTTNFFESLVQYRYEKSSTATVVIYDRAGNAGKCTYYAVTGASFFDNRTVTATPYKSMMYVYSDNTSNKGGLLVHFTAEAEL